MTKKSGRSEEYVFSEVQLNKLWSQCHDLKEKALIGLTAFCGFRVEEAIHTRLDWIRDQEIHIPSSMPCSCPACAKHPKHPGAWRPKTRGGARIFPIPAFLKPIFAEFLRYQPQGLGISRQAAYKAVQVLIKKAKLPKGFPHSLRASAATLYAQKGMTATELCYLFGWVRISMGDHYIRIATARAGAKDKMRQIFG